MKLRIGVDLDTTLNDLEIVWLERYNRDYGDCLTVEHMVDWDVSTYVKPECGRKMYDYLDEPGFFRRLGIKPGAREGMAFLSEHFEVYIVSAAHPNSVADKWAWIQEHLPFVPFEHFVPLSKKELLKLDYLIDDGPHNIERFPGTGIVFDMPYNRHLPSRHPRFDNWLDIRKYFENVLMQHRASSMHV